MACRLSNRVFQHSAFVTARSAIESVRGEAGLGSDAACLALLGPSGAGKSTVLETYEASVPRYRTEDGLVIPVLRVRVPEQPTVRSLAIAILEKLGDLKPADGTAAQLTIRVRKLLRETRTELLMFDELQHLVERSGRKIQSHVADWLKLTVDEVGVSLVIAGLPRAARVMQHNEQLKRRFYAPIHLDRYDWDDVEQRSEFLSVLHAMEEVIADLEPPHLGSEELGFRIYCATGGLIGYISKVLCKAEQFARASTQQVLTLEMLDEAYRMVMWPEDRVVADPFGREMSLQGDPELIARVMRIGSGSAEAEQA